MFIINNNMLINFYCVSLDLFQFYNSLKNCSFEHQPIQKVAEVAVVMWMEQDVLRRLAGGSRTGCIPSSGTSCGNKDGTIPAGVQSHGVALAATTRNWWSQLKTAGAAIYANRHYLALRQQRQQVLQRESVILPSLGKCRSTINSKLESGHSTIGHVYIHPTAQVHSTALVRNYIFKFYNRTIL